MPCLDINVTRDHYTSIGINFSVEKWTAIQFWLAYLQILSKSCGGTPIQVST